MAQNQRIPSDLEPPWYYQRWFLVIVFILGAPLISPPFVLWPVWAILILRSPWHNNVLLNGLAWAMLVTGAVMVYKNAQGEGGVVFTAASIVPGIIVTVITQVIWTRFRLEHGLVVQRPDPPEPPDFPDSMADSMPENMNEDESTEERRFRRSQRRRSSRSGRSSR